MRNTLALGLLLALTAPSTGLAQYAPVEGGPAYEEPIPPERGTRLRLGVDTFVNAGTNGHLFTMAVTTHLRAGVQIDDLWAVYYQAAAMVGGGLEISLFGGAGESKALYLHTSSVMAEVTLGDLFQLGLGPSFAIGVQGLPGLGEDLVYGGGGSLRAAFTFGGQGPGTRSGFSIGAQTDVAYMNAGNLVWMAGVTLGWETF